MLIASYILAGLILLWGTGNFFTYIIQDFFLFRPIKLKQNFKYTFKTPFEEHFIETPHGGHINALWFHREKSRPVVFYCHGNSSNLSRWGHLGKYFDDLGYDLFIYDFRGFGKSRGKRNEYIFNDDARVLFEYVSRRYDHKDIIVFGRSFGSGLACLLASENDVKMMILETPFYSIRHLFKTYYPFLPVSLFKFKYLFNNGDKLKQIDCPVHIFHGTRDRIIPLSCADKLETHLNDKSSFTIILGGKHKNLGDFEEYQFKLTELLVNEKAPPK